MTKIVKCLKCKCEFETEVDNQGIPYNRICKCCKRKNNAKLGTNKYIATGRTRYNFSD